MSETRTQTQDDDSTARDLAALARSHENATIRQLAREQLIANYGYDPDEFEEASP
jgi:hypothetical protein